MKVDLKLIVVVDDYHDIEDIANAIVGLEVSSRELGTTWGPGNISKYVGVIFEGCCPGDGEIADLLLEADIELYDES